ncbi:hypothetical protein PG985_004924 [Apiospora marii]|uniref:uncharacterized protein n=1 Tax=Apiospora marii TaxID=335849 RepID=UPI00312DB6FF
MSQSENSAKGTVTAPKRRRVQDTSSAVSPSANPDEDWTKISDLAVRRRIQNRIAQRNYRKKLKRRLEDLERRAATVDGSSTGSERKVQTPTSKMIEKPVKGSKSITVLHKTAQPGPQSTPPMHGHDELLSPPTCDDHERLHTPPYMTSSNYPPPPETMLPLCGMATYYTSITTAEGYSNCMATTMPCTVPFMTHFSNTEMKDSHERFT